MNEAPLKRDVYRPTSRPVLKDPDDALKTEWVMVPFDGSPQPPGPEYLELEMTDPVVTGEAIVGQTLTCSQPTVTGGSGDHGFIYTWKLVGSAETTFADGREVVVPPGVVGKQGYCEVVVTDVTADQSISKDSNVVGPVAPAREDITVTNSAQWADSGNNYFLGETVYAETAGFTGGSAATTTYRWRIQARPSADDDWTNYSWNTYTDHAEEVSFACPIVGQIRFQCQARDTGVDPVQQVNSFATVQTVGQRTIGDVVVTVDGNVVAGEESEDTIQTMTGQEHIIILTPDGDATGMKSDFQVRGGEARISQTANSCVVTIQGLYPGSVHVACKIEDRNTVEGEWSQRVVFIIREGEERNYPPKATWEPLHPPLGELLEVQCNRTVIIDQEIESNYQVNYEWEVNDPYSVNTNPGEHGVAVNLANMQRLYPEMGWIEAIAAGPQLVLHCTNPPDGEQDNRFHLRFTAHSKHPGIEPPYQSSYTKVRFLP